MKHPTTQAPILVHLIQFLPPLQDLLEESQQRLVTAMVLVAIICDRYPEPIRLGKIKSGA